MSIPTLGSEVNFRDEALQDVQLTWSDAADQAEAAYLSGDFIVSL